MAKPTPEESQQHAIEAVRRRARTLIDRYGGTTPVPVQGLFLLQLLNTYDRDARRAERLAALEQENQRMRIALCNRGMMSPRSTRLYGGEQDGG